MIIIAVLGLLILFVLIFVFSGKMNIFGKSVSSCQGKCSSGFITTSSSGSELCDQFSLNGEMYTYNPGATCIGDTKENKKACCILAYKP